MSESSESRTDWVFRLFDRRTITVKAKNPEVRKIAAVDIFTNTPFGIEIPSNISIDSIAVEKNYLATLRVYTQRNIEDVAPNHYEFFKELDVNQSMEDFIKAYWLYPKLIKFELVETESV